MDSDRESSFCERDTELLEEFASATEAYYHAVKELQRAAGYQETRKAHELAELARKQCACAREAVERHRKEHGCRMIKLPATNA